MRELALRRNLNSPGKIMESHPMDSFWNSDRAQNLTGAAVLVIVSMLSVYLLGQSSEPWPGHMALATSLFGLNLALFFLYTQPWVQRFRPRKLLMLSLEAVTIVSLYFLVNISFIAILGIVWIVQVAETLPIRTTGWLLAGAVSVFTISQTFHWQGTSLMLALTGSVTLSLFHLFAVIATHRARREQVLREETAALNRELLATRELLTEHSRQSERLRIARDLHDLLGHHLTAQILQLEVATHITEGDGRQKVEQALALGKLLLSDLRTAVSELREDEPIKFEDAIEKLISDLPGIQVQLDFEAQLEDINQAETLLRCTREALTNVLRHSNASECLITFNQQDSDFQLRISDNGVAREKVEPGNGLKGIQERVEETGGKVSWYTKNGFTVDIRLPVTGD
ncbi:two-component sensor histidine kinase [Pseudohongiella nitratireducens]|uniref:Two-component sensor histidine kinase n=1 Tax=Pseudohongiella nitratireducens TaxID=1768907 RepID=A0A916QL14_9GAMM|nr:sensor histidine kinase [Pseudohongiella nitratireducens]GFZ75842.1 two-component sensor histidine kinase [Pseudohongiella nitratireducens]